MKHKPAPAIVVTICFALLGVGIRVAAQVPASPVAEAVALAAVASGDATRSRMVPQRVELAGAPPPTPTNTPTPTSIWPPVIYVHGRVIDGDTGLGIEGATIRLYRSYGAEWRLIREKTTGEGGYWGTGISPAQCNYKLTEEDLWGWKSINATLPDFIQGRCTDPTAYGWNTIEFRIAPRLLNGEFIFTDVVDPAELTRTATPTPTETPRPTATATPEPPATHTPVPTPPPGPGTLHGYVWTDLNGDDRRRPEEVYVGVMVTLRDRQTTTDERGHYRFDDVEPGEYELEVADPKGRFPPITVVVDARGIDLEPVFHDIRLHSSYWPLVFGEPRDVILGQG